MGRKETRGLQKTTAITTVREYRDMFSWTETFFITLRYPRKFCPQPGKYFESSDRPHRTLEKISLPAPVHRRPIGKWVHFDNSRSQLGQFVQRPKLSEPFEVGRRNPSSSISIPLKNSTVS